MRRGGTIIIQARGKSTEINFLGPETARWGGGLPCKGVVVKKLVLSLESLSSLGFEERNLGCPGNFAGMSRSLGGVQKVCTKKVRAHFSFPNNSNDDDDDDDDDDDAMPKSPDMQSPRSGLHLQNLFF